ncbi:beta-class carbonic anhydrase [Calidifontibacillus erzurumensis]|uniref:carbonic anhydrase n=1 Tax=Calidifontibacillus erzurumensis TaxID=2741433 RepID=A0A8J8KD49_9BACI|nr:carbonic anhydrase [Calidifontibacillus erzurumensis]NSL52658.1 carbonic anhydrase [Calidifontibacillus erzurumensis]
MSRLGEILEHNKQFVHNQEYEQFRTTKYPDKHMVILTCMDTRLTDLLPKAMNVRHGDAKIIKNAGAIVSHPFGSIMRSILVAVYSLGAKEVFVVGHHDCGMTDLCSHEILDEAILNGISEETIDILRHSGIDIDEWLKGFSNVADSVAQSVSRIRHHPLFPKDVAVHGLIIHPETGKLDVVVNGYEVIESTIT